jgi:hypothetical protein
MKFLRGLLFAVCLIFGSQPSTAVNKKHERAEKAVLILYGRSASLNVSHIPLCTAFVYKKASDGYFLLTAGHCFVRSHAPVDATYAVSEGQIVDNPTNLQSVEVLNYVDDGKMDVAELHLKTDKKYPILELDNAPTNIDDKVFYVGYPEMVSQVVYTGRVGSKSIEIVTGPDSENPCDVCVGRFLVQTGGGHGASGSPVISEKTGKVVGILEGHLFENGVIVIPAAAIHLYYLKEGHVQLKNARSETGAVQ